ncbi:hypothetical protein N825_15175 [Skermanella stibiiresistens SB22]|uniref:DUF4384 domain-containing protein n=1 Tax=Skermanella stibiiresistens SB22 TaxID=1385369 RepID=W9H2T2_9PROT|nr:DUF4384 domain-containing protein [Skermanella stibiiresistens]EWY38073.1 hypothetical protein N825_15175 [Skermanella stibiiresistens SB22]
MRIRYPFTHLARSALGLALAACLGGVGSATADQAIVVAATVPGFTVGQVVEDGAPVHLPEGTNALFLFASGRTITIKGPYDGPLDRLSGGSPAQGRLSGLFAADRFSQGELGAARTVGPAKGRSGGELAPIDLSLPGTWCAPTNRPPELQKPSDPAFDTVILHAPGVDDATIAWPTGAQVRPWPAKAPLVDGARMLALSGDRTHSSALVLRLVDDKTGASGDAGALAVALVRAGCTRQAEPVLAALGETLAPLDLSLSSDRGLYPTYRQGDQIRLVLQTNRDAHLYCYLRRRNDLIPIFPSPESGGSLVKSHTPMTFPGDRMPLPLSASDLGGDSEVRCFAADRDLTPSLPGGSQSGAQAGAQAFRPMGKDAVERLEATLDGLRQTRLVVAQIVMRVE